MNEIKPLTSIRGLFALYVAIYHIFPRTNAFLANGYLSVDLFFVLSGFIMSYVYSVKFSSNIQINDYLLYIKGRFARVYPLYAFIIIITSFFYFKNEIPTPSFKDYIILFSFLQSITDVDNNLIPHAWSIAVEFIAYLIFPFAMLCLSKRHGFITLAIVTLAAFIGLYMASSKGYWGPLDVFSGGFSVVRCLSDYALGIVSFFALQAAREKLNGKVLDALLIFLVAFAFATLNFRGFDLLVVACFALIVPLLSESHGIVYKLMSFSPLVYLGEISYSIYLIHYPLCRKLAFIPGWLHNKIWLIDVNYIALLMTVIISIFTYHFIEVPFRSLIRGTTKRTAARV